MQINTLSPLRNLGGEKNLRRPDWTNKEGETVEGEEHTFREIAITALFNEDPKKPLTGMKKVERYVLAEKIKTKDSVDLTAEEVVLLKNLIGEEFEALVVGAMWEILDPAVMRKVRGLPPEEPESGPDAAADSVPERV